MAYLEINHQYFLIIRSGECIKHLYATNENVFYYYEYFLSISTIFRSLHFFEYYCYHLADSYKYNEWHMFVIESVFRHRYGSHLCPSQKQRLILTIQTSNLVQLWIHRVRYLGFLRTTTSMHLQPLLKIEKLNRYWKYISHPKLYLCKDANRYEHCKLTA